MTKKKPKPGGVGSEEWLQKCLDLADRAIAINARVDGVWNEWFEIRENQPSATDLETKELLLRARHRVLFGTETK